MLEPCAATSGTHGSEGPQRSNAPGLSDNYSRHVRDVTFGDDISTLRTRNLPANLATIRCAVINTLRRAGSRFIPDGRRHHTRPTEALNLHGFP